jgi:hypothetical protein
MTSSVVSAARSIAAIAKATVASAPISAVRRALADTAATAGNTPSTGAK